VQNPPSPRQRGRVGSQAMAQCQSNVFFPDDPSQPPQFNDCPRQAETSRRTWRRGEPSRGEPRIVVSVVRLCARCAAEWDAHPAQHHSDSSPSSQQPSAHEKIASRGS